MKYVLKKVEKNHGPCRWLVIIEAAYPPKESYIHPSSSFDGNLVLPHHWTWTKQNLPALPPKEST